LQNAAPGHKMFIAAGSDFSGGKRKRNRGKFALHILTCREMGGARCENANCQHSHSYTLKQYHLIRLRYLL